MEKSKYNELVKKKTPNSPIVKNCLFAFVVGGLICVIGQIIKNIIMSLGVGADDVKIVVPVILIFLGGLLTAIGIYDKIGKFAGGGSIVPITGFANSIVSSAIEFKSEGFIMGLGAKLFTVAGPVIVYGTVASVIYGVIYWILQML